MEATDLTNEESSLLADERIPANSPLAPWISVHAGVMHGAPCFAGTRVPVQVLFDHVTHGTPLEEFLEGFPDVTREQALAVLALAAETFNMRLDALDRPAPK